MKRVASIILVFSILLLIGAMNVSVYAEEGTEESDVSVFVEPDTYADHEIYSFTFDEENANTLLKKSGATPGVINREVYSGDSGASLALTIGPNSMTGKGGVLPYIWPNGVSGVIAAQGDLKEGEYYEFQIDVAWDGKMMTKKGTYIYPFILINGKYEAYFEKVSEGIQELSPEFQTYVYRVYDILDTPKSGSDSGGIAFCCENSLTNGGTLYFDNIRLIKHGEWVDCDTTGITYLESAVAPTTYEVTDENGVTITGKQSTVLYENDFEGPNPESVFGHYDPDLAKHFRIEYGNGLKNNDTNYNIYFIPSSSTPTKLPSPGGSYPAIWLYNDSIKEALKNERPLNDGEYYIFQMDIYCGTGYAYATLIAGDKEYEPLYEWDSTNLSGNISSFGPEFITRYYVFGGKGMDLSKGNVALMMMTEGYIKSFVGVYLDNFKITSVKFPDPDPVLIGDANKDGKVNMKDILVIRKYMAKLDTPIDLIAADVNKDELVNMKDVLFIRKYMAHLMDSFE